MVVVGFGQRTLWIVWWQLDEDNKDDEDEKDDKKEDQEEEEEKGRRRRTRQEEVTDIKPNNLHLAVKGEKQEWDHSLT